MSSSSSSSSSPLLGRLRIDLDVLPSPIPDRPGFVLRDPFRYSEAAMVVPAALAQSLALFDGGHTEDDLRGMLARLTGGAEPAVVARLAGELVRGLSEAGFLDDDGFRAMRAHRHATFAAAPTRAAAFAGGAYPAEAGELSRTVEEWVSAGPGRAHARPPLAAIAAPHVSPHGAAATYGAAYGALSESARDRTFVVLGTSHYGRPNRFGLTRKSFVTPLGVAATDAALVDELLHAAPGAIEMEDYCHAIEHSIEFQIVFLQALFGPALSILPILCGPFVTNGHHLPESDGQVGRMLGALGDLQARHDDRLLWVLGVDLAHVGRRYGDDVVARANEAEMNTVMARDRARLAHVAAGEAAAFWELAHAGDHGPGDDLKWCGSSPLYAFLRANPGVRGQVLDYGQWNIDEASVVSFAALSFVK